MQSLKFNRYSTILSTISLLLAAVSISISFFTYQKTNEQFKSLNQGYLKVEPEIHLKSNTTLNSYESNYGDQDEIISSRYNLKITNGGNLPISMRTTQFDVYLNGVKIELGKSDETQIMLLYPNDKTNFASAEIFFDDEKPVQFSQLKQATLRLDFKIEYSDVGDTYTKTIERSVYAILNTYPAKIQVLRIDDAI